MWPFILTAVNVTPNDRAILFTVWTLTHAWVSLKVLMQCTRLLSVVHLQIVPHCQMLQLLCNHLLADMMGVRNISLPVPAEAHLGRNAWPCCLHVSRTYGLARSFPSVCHVQSTPQSRSSLFDRQLSASVPDSSTDAFLSEKVSHQL